MRDHRSVYSISRAFPRRVREGKTKAVLASCKGLEYRRWEQTPSNSIDAGVRGECGFAQGALLSLERDGLAHWHVHWGLEGRALACTYVALGGAGEAPDAFCEIGCLTGRRWAWL